MGRARLIFVDNDPVDGLFARRYGPYLGLRVGSPCGTRIVSQEIDHQDARLTDAIETLKQWQKLGEQRRLRTRSYRRSLLAQPSSD